MGCNVKQQAPHSYMINFNIFYNILNKLCVCNNLALPWFEIITQTIIEKRKHITLT
jgi:hypothetical protein